MKRKIDNKMIKAVLFDLGKVILHFDFTPAFRKLSDACLKTPNEIDDYFRRSGLEVLYDGGKITSKKFYQEVKKALGHELTFDEFKDIWNEIFEPNQKIVALIGRLKKQYKLVLISNTNAMHFEYIVKRYPVLGHFDKHILSYKEKVRKPDERIYRAAIRACGAMPHEILYIDDRPDLTEAAQGIGLHTFTFKNNADELIRRMKKLEIL